MREGRFQIQDDKEILLLPSRKEGVSPLPKKVILNKKSINYKYFISW